MRTSGRRSGATASNGSSDVRLAVLETDGSISVIPMREGEPD